MDIPSQIESLGILCFNDEGILFAGDNWAGAVHAFDLGSEKPRSTDFALNIYRIDEQIAALIGTTAKNIQIIDIAVHPISGEVYLSISRGHGQGSQPGLLKVNAEEKIQVINLASLPCKTKTLKNLPEPSRKVALRGMGGSPPSEKDRAKAQQSLRILSIVAMEFYQGELFVAGINNEEFCSVLRRMKYPFDENEGISHIEMFHIVHDRYESRAPIRAMTIKQIDGQDQMVAAYTCSPLVLIPIAELKDKTKVRAKTVGDMGNGQPIDMVPFQINGEEMLFVTNNSRSPLQIPLSGLQNAKGLGDKDFERGVKLDTHPIMPYGPIGKSVMFSGASLRIDLLNEHQFISLNRDFERGSLDLETLATKIPFRMHNIIGDGDIPKA